MKWELEVEAGKRLLLDGAANITCRLTKMLRTLERSLKP